MSVGGGLPIDPIVDPTDLADEAAPIGAPATPENELTPPRPASHREAVTMGEPADWLNDTLHDTAESREGVVASRSSRTSVPPTP